MPAEPLARRISALPDSANAAAAVERLREAADAQGAGQALDAVLGDANVAAFLGSALGDCPYLLDLAAKDIGRLAAMVGDAPEARVKRIAAGIGGAEWPARADTMAALRVAKQEVALTLGLADLAGAIDLEAVTRLLTTFADAALGAALRFALADAARAGKWTGGVGAPPGFFILGMGKYGAGELNYSSDIDIIALFDPEAPGVVSGDPSTFWVGIMRKLVPLMQERTKDGYVFRTDLRLRPDPAATRIAISAPAALSYYESMGQNWERAALIKARAVAGNIAAGETFIRELSPFIWRKYLDFAAIADIHSIKRQVHAHRGHGTVAVLGHDIKRGRGGIREIEFFVQTQQLIAGGRDPSLRGTETRAMLKQLTAKGWIDESAEAELDHAYVVLRNVEHRLQMVRDEQTHQLPRNREDLARIGRLMRNADPAAFEAELRAILETVARRYSELFENAEELSGAGSLVFTGGEDDPETLETLRKLGFERPELVTETVRGWHFGRFAAMRSTAARENLTEITPALLKAFSRAGNPDAAVHAFDSLLKAMPAGAQLFALLRNNPDLLDLLATILSAAPRLAEVFARRPHVADALLDPSRLGGVDTLEGVSETLERSLAEARRYEDVLDRARLFVAERKFLISVGLLNGVIPPADAGKAFSELAEAVVAALFRHTRREFALKHGRLPAEQAAIVGFGRLGSREMTASSDLDLIVIYDHAPDAMSDGARSLAPSQYFSRLTQRLIAALSAPTSEGIAYEVDLRLRPSGRAGPLATSIEAFENYQLTDAWTWEHMAMSRGRAIAGDAGLMQRVSGVLDALVGKRRGRSMLAAEVASMRARIEREKVAAHVFDVKLAKGGLIDCEFAAQFLVLAGLGRCAGETTLETLERATGEGRLPPELAERLVLSAALQGALLQIIRVSYPKGFSPDEAPEAEKRLMVEVSDTALKNSGIGAERAGVAGFAELEARLIEVQRGTRAALEEVLGVAVA